MASPGLPVAQIYLFHGFADLLDQLLGVCLHLCIGPVWIELLWVEIVHSRHLGLDSRHFLLRRLVARSILLVWTPRPVSLEGIHGSTYRGLISLLIHLGMTFLAHGFVMLGQHLFPLYIGALTAAEVVESGAVTVLSHVQCGNLVDRTLVVTTTLDLHLIGL